MIESIVGYADGLSVQMEINTPDLVPNNIAYDGAYEVFYATNADDIADSPSADTQVYEIGMDGGTRPLFAFDSGILGNFVVSSLHYAPNTGTLFALCGSCPAIAEVLNRLLNQLLL